MKEDKQMIKILQINSGSENFGGVSGFLYTLFTNIDREQVKFDFLSPELTTYGLRRAEIESMGGNIYELKIIGNVLTRKIKLYTELKKFLKTHNYEIVHVNSGNFFFNLFAGAAIKASGVKIRIVHSHNAGDATAGKLKENIRELLKPLMEKQYTHHMACSVAAEKFMFSKKMCDSKKVKLVHNGINIANYIYKEEARDRLRAELGIENKYVVGHVGRFLKQKNHNFLIDVFDELLKKEPEAVLLLVGTGDLEDEIKEKVRCLGLQGKVKFLGARKDVADLYQAMDVFFLPSLHEGLGIVGLEAQVSGLVIVMSSNVPDEVKIIDRVSFIGLDENMDSWCDALLKGKCVVRGDFSKEMIAAGYSAKEVAAEMLEFYKKAYQFYYCGND